MSSLEKLRGNIRTFFKNKGQVFDHVDRGFLPTKFNKHAWIIENADGTSPQIGEEVWIGAFCLIDGRRSLLKIGTGTNVSSGAQILTHSTVRRCVSEGKHDQVDTAPTEIGEYCFIGTSAVILMGVKIGHHSVIGAGAVVPEFMVVPPWSIVTGVPGKVVGDSHKYLENEKRK